MHVYDRDTVPDKNPPTYPSMRFEAPGPDARCCKLVVCLPVSLRSKRVLIYSAFAYTDRHRSQQGVHLGDLSGLAGQVLEACLPRPLCLPNLQ